MVLATVVGIETGAYGSAIVLQARQLSGLEGVAHLQLNLGLARVGARRLHVSSSQLQAAIEAVPAPATKVSNAADATSRASRFFDHHG
jgi:hypothetical protein